MAFAFCGQESPSNDLKLGLHSPDLEDFLKPNWLCALDVYNVIFFGHNPYADSKTIFLDLLWIYSHYTTQTSSTHVLDLTMLMAYHSQTMKLFS